jgi:hypothetical protein
MIGAIATYFGICLVFGTEELKEQIFVNRKKQK